MSQQLNLLAAPPAGPRFGAARAVQALLLGVLLLAAGWWIGQREIAQARAAVVAKDTQLTQLRQSLATLKAREAQREQPEAIAAEIARVMPMATLSREVLARIAAGDLGQLGGFSTQLESLAALASDGVWLTAYSAEGKGGVILTGRALHADLVLPYSRRLNEAFASHDIQFTAVEITPLPGPFGDNAVSFRLSEK